jgi:hypothetical protein
MTSIWRRPLIEATTDADGRLTLLLPVGSYTLSAYNPFHGTKSVTGTISYSGQVIQHELVFEESSTVRVHVVDVGLTPVPRHGRHAQPAGDPAARPRRRAGARWPSS